MNIFANLPIELKYKIMRYAIITNSAKAVNIYINWYQNFLKNHETYKKISFKDYYFTKLKRLDTDLFLKLINYKVIRKKRIYYR
jgi:hypothetical protein